VFFLKIEASSKQKKSTDISNKVLLHNWPNYRHNEPVLSDFSESNIQRVQDGCSASSSLHVIVNSSVDLIAPSDRRLLAGRRRPSVLMCFFFVDVRAESRNEIAGYGARDPILVFLFSQR